MTGSSTSRARPLRGNLLFDTPARSPLYPAQSFAGPSAGRPGGTAMRHVRIVVVLSLLWLFPASGGAQDKPIELKFSSWVSAVHGHHTGVMVPWAKMVEEKSGGRLKITLYPGSTLGKAADHVDLVTGGIADMGFASPGMTPGRFTLISVAERPTL